MKLKSIACAVIFALSSSVSANETTKYFGDRSWQWKTPSDKALDNQRLMVRCAAKPTECPAAGPGTAFGGTGGFGMGLASGQNIGNLINVYINGDGNVVTISGDQTNNGDQTVDIDVQDNDLDISIDDHSQVINGEGSNNRPPAPTVINPPSSRNP